MNLELDLKENKVNPNLELFSKAPFVPSLVNNSAMLYNYHDYDISPSRFNNVRHTPSNFYLTDVNDLNNVIDMSEFAKTTSLNDVVKLIEQLNFIDERFGTRVRRLGTDYHFGVTKKFNWKRGIYDAMNTYSDWCAKKQMRHSGIERFFIRIEDGVRSLHYLKDHINRCDSLRKRVKETSGSLVDNLDELLERQNHVLETIKTNTEEANAFSEYFDVYNYVNSDTFDAENTSTYLNLKLFTVVVAHPKPMSIINRNGDKLGEINTPLSYLVFSRKLFKVLSNVEDKNINTVALSPGAYHPYINGTAYYNRFDSSNLNHEIADSSRLNSVPWGSLCLSGYHDDIVRPLSSNDYLSFVMGLSNWNSIYNLESTNPYFAPNLVIYHQGFDKNMTKDTVKSFRQVISFFYKDCFSHGIRNEVDVETDETVRSLNRRINKNYAYYSENVLNSCDAKECPLRDNCSPYLETSSMLTFTEDIDYMFESYVGFKLEILAEIEGFALTESLVTTKFARYISNVLMSPNPIITLHNNLQDGNYWDRNPEPENLDADALETRMNQWMSRRNDLPSQIRRPNHGN